MSNRTQHSIQNLLRNWLSGNTSADQEKTLRNEAKNDPFLQDALDGFDQNKGAHSQNLSKLQGKLQKRYQTKKNKTRVLYLPRIAASAAILIIGLAGIWFLNQNTKGSNNKNIVEAAPQAKESIKEDPIVEEVFDTKEEPEQTSAADQLAEVPTKPETPKKPKTKKKNTPKKTKEKPIVEKAKEEPVIAYKERVEEEKTSEDVFVEIEAAESTTIPDAVVSAPASVIPEPEPVIDSSVYGESNEIIVGTSIEPYDEDDDGLPDLLEPETAAIIVLSDSDDDYADNVVEYNTIDTIVGQITDANGDALIGVNVLEANTNNGTVSDLDGQFQLLPISTENLILITYVGYQDKILQPVFGEENNIILDAGEELEQVIISSDTRENKAEEMPIYGKTQIETFPSNGYEEYKKYLDESLLYPQSAANKEIEGKVVVEFQVTDKGRPQNFKVKESLGHGCDEEAIRLLENGPDWKSQNPTESTPTKFTIQFKLKKD